MSKVQVERLWSREGKWRDKNIVDQPLPHYALHVTRSWILLRNQVGGGPPGFLFLFFCFFLFSDHCCFSVSLFFENSSFGMGEGRWHAIEPSPERQPLSIARSITHSDNFSLSHSGAETFVRRTRGFVLFFSDFFPTAHRKDCNNESILVQYLFSRTSSRI